MYSEAKDLMSEGSYESAIKELEQLQARFPHGSHAQQAQLDIAYAYYKMNDAASAIASADRFIKQFPSHPSVDYAIYLKGLANVNEERGFFAFLSIDELAERDPKASQMAFDAFKELVTRFPQSRYADDATKRMAQLVNAMSMSELHAARYYLNRRAPLAAVNRAQTLIKNYPDAPAVEEALAIMVKGYEQLGLATLRNDAERVLRQNYPRSRFLTGQKTG